MYLTECEPQKMKLGASSLACGMIVTGGSAAGFTLIAARTAALAIPVVGIVIGVSLVVFGSLMMYQAQKGERQPPSLVGGTVEIPDQLLDQLPDQKKIESMITPSRVSVPSKIWQRRAMAMAAIVGMYGLMKLGSSYVSSDSAQPTPTGSSVGAAVGGLDNSATIPDEPVCPAGSSDPFSSFSIPGGANASNDPWNTLYAYLKTHDEPVCMVGSSDPFSSLPITGGASASNDPWNIHAYFKTFLFGSPSTLKASPEQYSFSVSMPLVFEKIADADVSPAGSGPASSFGSFSQGLPTGLIKGTPLAEQDRSKQAATLFLYPQSFTRTAEFDKQTCPLSDPASVFSRPTAWMEEKSNLNEKENRAIQTDNSSWFLSAQGSQSKPSVPLERDVSSPSFPYLETISKVTSGALKVLGVTFLSVYSFWKTTRYIAAGVFGFVCKKALLHPHRQSGWRPSRKPPSEPPSGSQRFSPGVFFPVFAGGFRGERTIPFGGGSGGTSTIPVERNIGLEASQPSMQTNAQDSMFSPLPVNYPQFFEDRLTRVPSLNRAPPSGHVSSLALHSAFLLMPIQISQNIDSGIADDEGYWIPVERFIRDLVELTLHPAPFLAVCRRSGTLINVRDIDFINPYDLCGTRDEDEARIMAEEMEENERLEQAAAEERDSPRLSGQRSSSPSVEDRSELGEQSPDVSGQDMILFGVNDRIVDGLDTVEGIDPSEANEFEDLGNYAEGIGSLSPLEMAIEDAELEREIEEQEDAIQQEIEKIVTKEK